MGGVLLDSRIPESGPSPPLLVVLSGPSGVGKDAVLDELRKLERPWHFAVTATTRPMRPGERDGVDYVFLEPGAFERMRERDEFLECAEVYGRWYGVPRSQARDALRSGRDVILKIDVQGAATIRRMAPEALLIFLIPPSLDELRQRLQGRMTEPAAELERRPENGGSGTFADSRIRLPGGQRKRGAAAGGRRYRRYHNRREVPRDAPAGAVVIMRKLRNFPLLP